MRTIQQRWSRPWAGYAVAALSYGLATAHADESAAIANQAENCQSCHRGTASLAGKPTGVVTATIRVIADGDSQHPPVNITLDLDDRNIEALAKTLTAAQ
jgi:mono/diheme cytochrome c family protein